jgi:4-amino-4-deoxy-L-arabinose transferase-like glycosyltransferase
MVTQRPARLTVVAVLLAGVLIRLVHLDQPLLSFHPTRQYRSAIIARACYVDRADVPEWSRQVAHANRALQPAGEPPLLEWLACAGYLAVGKEQLAIPRLLSIVAWMAGALPLFSLARRLSGAAAASVALATYLFLPYGIVASRSFQPDALMTAAALFALAAIARAFEQASRRRLMIAAAALGAAAVIKPMSVFLTVPAVVGLAVAHGSFAALRRRAPWIVLSLGLLPPVLVYGYGAAFGTLARDQMRLRFVPGLIPTAFFWGGLWQQISRVLGPATFTIALLGTVLAERRARAVLTAVWAGYLLFAVAFTYHMPTHDYYHLPYITLAALGSAALVGTAQRHLAARGFARLADAGVLAAIVLVAATGAFRAWPQLATGDQGRIAMYREIGALAEHHRRVLFLDTEYGYPLMYHGEVSGDAWPGSDDLAAEALGGAAPIGADERFARDFADYGAAFFLVTDLRSLREQPDLQRWLASHADVVRATTAYHVYRLHATEARE